MPSVIGARGNRLSIAQIKHIRSKKKKGRKRRRFTPSGPLTKQQRRERAESLRILGFSSYGEYLASPRWQGIRKSVLERDAHKCIRCKKTATQVHHTEYDLRTMAGTTIDKLQSSCGNCHENSHKLGEGLDLRRNKNANPRKREIKRKRRRLHAKRTAERRNGRSHKA